MPFTNTFTKGAVVMFNNEPHLVTEKEFYSPAKGSSFQRVKLKNLKTGKLTPQTFKSIEKIEQLDVETRTMQYLYFDDNNAYFMDPSSFEQIPMPLDQIPNRTDFLHTDGKYIFLIYEGVPISVQLPLKMIFTVTETSDSVKGNTANSATKEAIVETGLKVQVPMFIKLGDKISVNTEFGAYYSKEN